MSTSQKHTSQKHTSVKQTSLKHTSVKQIEANRRNSQKSTGAKTEQGKRNSACNNLKHGLYSNQIVIKSAAYSEDPVEYEQLLESLHEELKPAGKLQEHLVIKIANCIWRSHRVIRAETAHINAQMDRSHLDLESAEDSQQYRARFNDKLDSELTAEERGRIVENSLGKRSIPIDTTALYILRCEMRLDRQLSRSYALLRSLQAKAAADFKKIKTVYKEGGTIEDLNESSEKGLRAEPLEACLGPRLREDDERGEGDVKSEGPIESDGSLVPKRGTLVGKPFVPEGKAFLYDDDPTMEPLIVANRKHRRRARAKSS